MVKKKEIIECVVVKIFHFEIDQISSWTLNNIMLKYLGKFNYLQITLFV